MAVKMPLGTCDPYKLVWNSCLLYLANQMFVGNLALWVFRIVYKTKYFRK